MTRVSRSLEPILLARFSVLIAVLVAVLGTIGPARAQPPAPIPAKPPALRPAADEDVTVLAPPVVPAPSNAAAQVDPPPDLAPFAGQTITGVEVVVDDDRWPDVRPPNVTVMRAGDRVSPALARLAITEALSSGYFADGHVTLTPEAGGVRAAVHVMPRKVIDSFRVDLHGAQLDSDQLLRDADLAADGELVGREVPIFRQRIEALLQRRGFPAPQVTLATRPTDDPLRVVLFVDINAGAPRRIERRAFYPFGGTRAEADLAERAYAMKLGERADEGALDAADADLQARVRARGFHDATVTHDVVLHRGLVVLRVRLDFGKRFESRFEGNDHYDKTTLDGVLELEDETDRTSNHLVQKIHDFYVKHGFLDAEVRIEERGGPKDPTHYLVFHIVEHQRVYVAGRSYPCFKEDDVKHVDEAPSTAKGIGSEIDSYLEEELPGNELLVAPRVSGVDATVSSPLAEKGAHPSPLELDPDSVYAPETYERAVQHVQELYRAEGFLSAAVGPVQVMRRRCDPRSPPGECVPIRVPPPPDVCTYDAIGVPLPVVPLEQGSTCVPDPAHGVECEPRVWLRIPVKLGPRTQLWDVAFSGVRALAPKDLAAAAALRLGGWVSTAKIEEARRRVADAYKEEGYAFVDVKYSLEPSPDRTRARVRFQVTEGEQVFVRQIIVKGNAYTRTPAIMRRVALAIGQPYRASDIRKTEERIATLGAFASVNVALENPYVPQRNKVVIVTVVERPRQYTEVAPGFSTGEGFRIATEYGHRNLWGNAVQLTLRLQLAYIPTELIIDPTARDNYRDLELIARIGVRATAGIIIPEVGLGPLVRTGVDALVVHDLQRDFYLTKLAAIPNINYHPVTPFQVTYFQSFELNNSRIFRSSSVNEYLLSKSRETGGELPSDLVRQLLVPDGLTYAFSQRALATLDFRDNAFNPSRGTYVASSVEHVDAYPIIDADLRAKLNSPGNVASVPVESHFFKFIETFSGYIPLPRGLRVASQTRVGFNVPIVGIYSNTYPDRLFFLGGVDSMRGWTLNSFMPQDNADSIDNDRDKPDTVIGPDGSPIPNPTKVTASTRPIRGGNLMVNERLELRIPIKKPVETVLFADLGNLWIDPSYPFDRKAFPIRVAVGTGLRFQTPVGPLAFDIGFNAEKLLSALGFDVRSRSYEDLLALNFAIGLF
jgi:outer membrane protein assembly factor BamA